MMGDDAAGPLLARAMKIAPIKDWNVLDGGSVPENCLHLIRDMAPELVLIVDAADMDLSPGEVRLIDPDRIDDYFPMTTHTLPLAYLVQALRAFTPRVDLLGIQPRAVAFGLPISQEVRSAVKLIYQDLMENKSSWESLQAEDQNLDKDFI